MHARDGQLYIALTSQWISRVVVAGGQTTAARAPRKRAATASTEFKRIFEIVRILRRLLDALSEANEEAFIDLLAEISAEAEVKFNSNLLPFDDRNCAIKPTELTLRYPEPLPLGFSCPTPSMGCTTLGDIPSGLELWSMSQGSFQLHLTVRSVAAKLKNKLTVAWTYTAQNEKLATTKGD